ncbi:protein kinase [Clostridium acetobutylicum]|uniref:non-specific serine/threonine protein kinase n=1 Tax=Clostridium acetobutylicum (strain ATCC 824 / DSM 792 / JCM 1419 / IAM 19013 / LMG 5710 / NBRC 13948 / NRRL B-527 / VKM B-1787 / 2291 / W) TaxID=272562 RepID=Q97LZ6_CLOAB|nr:Serine/threonine protein kinase fused to TPR repeats domain [Clostridium acetobutylicum ATCC 824]AEI34187.1 TPR repeat-containing serine/ threonine-protein kinase [Clostridium acetobutylicum DSM 1731]AWV80107.1 tetratricopeptide repeat protein [Clostridium acetobutylicum]PSM05909.1 serine/threonine protein kinase [Clostridium sp. NJ4]MBC2392286.1 protein kinase [Clostridium acetobutylicum]
MVKSDIIIVKNFHGVFCLNLVNEIFENKYKIIDILGKGGMSTVYLAKDIKLQKFWAIKEVSNNINDTSKLKVDLLAETNILKKLDHPALPRIVDIIKRDESLYIVMDFIDGVSLDKFIHKNGAINEKVVLDWAKQICDVLSYLHSQKPNPIIYRDMKPGNLMLTQNGKIKLIDFGIAREYKKEVSKDTTYIGTRGYAAPEQYGDCQSDARTDIYSFGVTLYHMLTGKGPNDPPFELKPVRELNSSLSEGIEHIIEKSTRQDPSLRYQNVDEMLYDIKNIHKLNSKYKKQLVKKYIKVAASACLFIFSVFLIISGVLGIKSDSANEYNNIIENGSKQNGDKAVEYFKQAVDKNSSNPKAYIKIIDTYLENGEYDQSIDFIETNLNNKQSELLKDNELLFKIGMAYFDDESYAKAYQYFNKIKGADISISEPLKYYKPVANALSKVDLQNKDKIVSSITQLEKYIDSRSDVDYKVESYITLAELYRDNPQIFPQNTDKEIGVLEKASSVSANKNNAILYGQLGQAYFDKASESKIEQDKYNFYLNKALDSYKNSIQMGSKISNTYCKLGLIYKYLGNTAESKNTFQKETQLFSDDYKGYMEMALLEYDSQQSAAPETRNYSEFVKYYNSTVSKKYNENDVDFMTLKQEYNDLKNQGVIK